MTCVFYAWILDPRTHSPISIESPWDFELSFVSHPFLRHMIHRYTMANGAVWHILLRTLWGVPGPWTLCSHGGWPRACRGEVPQPPRGSMATWQRWQCPIALGEWRSGTLAADMDIICRKWSRANKSEKHRHKSLFKVERSLFGVFVLQLLLASKKRHKNGFQLSGEFVVSSFQAHLLLDACPAAAGVRCGVWQKCPSN